MASALRGRDLLQVARRFPDFPIVAETFRECLHDHLDVQRVRQILTDIREGRIEVRSARLEVASPFAAGLLFGFQMATMYHYDDVEPESSGGFGRLDQELLDQLVAPDGRHLPLDVRAVHQVERRLRGLGQPPRSVAEMAEWLRRLGDASKGDLEGPMAGFLDELEKQGRATKITLARVPEPERWVLTEELDAYRDIFEAKTGEFGETQRAGEKILLRFMETHALVGLQDILARYPFEPAWAKRILEAWGNNGRIVRVETPEALQWSAPTNFEQMQRGTLAVHRREVVSSPATQFVDFMLRWQRAHPAQRAQGRDGLADVLERLQACYLPWELWEQTVLPIRVSDYQTSWLDETLAGGDWLWAGRGDEEMGPGEVAVLRRETVKDLAYPVADNAADADTVQVLEKLRQRRALYLTDLAQEIAIAPGRLRHALWSLVRLGLVTNDSLDAVRRGEEKPIGEPKGVSPRVKRPRSNQRPEGRWSLIPWGIPDAERQALFAAKLLLQRYGIVARELALMDDRMPPWRVLYEVLSRLEMAGEVRRGFFVEGLSGAQFALAGAVGQLQEAGLPSQAEAPLVLLHSLDPANMYGTGAPLDIPLLDEGTRPFFRRIGNWLVLKGGRPVLLIEQQGKKLTPLASARPEDLAKAVALLPHILGKNQWRDIKHKLVVETWNEQPVTSTPGKDMLAAAGFVRDYQSMAWYAVFN